MFPIYVCCDSGVTRFEREAIKRGLNEISPVFNTKFYFYGSDQWKSGSYKSADAIIRASHKNEKGQVDAFSVLNKLEIVNGDIVEPGAIVLFTSEDLYARTMRKGPSSSKDLRDTGLSWCFGMAIQDRRITVQSVRRYRSLSDDIMSFCIRRTQRHELGHLFGCAMRPSRSNTELKQGCHCTNRGCSMCQTMSLAELAEKRFYEDDHNFLCEQCKQDLRRFVEGYENDERRKASLVDAYRQSTRGVYSGIRRL